MTAAMIRTLLLSVGIGCLPVGAFAVPVTVLNPGFEADVNAPNSFTFGAPTDWLPYNTGAVVNESIGTLNPHGTTYFDAGQFGGNNVAIAYIDVNGTVGVEFGIRQILSATLQADTIYTLQVDVGNIASGESIIGANPNPTFFNLEGFSGYRVELRAGDQLLAADLNTLSIPEAEFRTSQVIYDSSNADAGLIGQNLEIRLVNLNLIDPVDVTAHREVDFDNVTLDAAVVPIPAAVWLLGSAVIALSVRRRAI